MLIEQAQCKHCASRQITPGLDHAHCPNCGWIVASQVEWRVVWNIPTIPSPRSTTATDAVESGPKPQLAEQLSLLGGVS